MPGNLQDLKCSAEIPLCLETQGMFCLAEIQLHVYNVCNQLSYVSVHHMVFAYMYNFVYMWKV